MNGKSIHYTGVLILFLLWQCAMLTAQKNYLDSIPPRGPYAILQIGSNFAINSDEPTIFRSGAVSIEFALNRSNFLGFQYARLYASDNVSRNGVYDFANGYTDDSFAKYNKGNEFGMFFKTFLHPRFSHRRSNYYFGFGFRKGRRDVSITYRERDFNTGLIISSEFINAQHKHKKYLLLIGYQYNFKHVVFEIGAPVGIEKITTDQKDKVYSESISQLVTLVVLQIGYKF